MAQVVQQKAPPYLTIIFAFIAAVAIVGNVLFYMEYDEAETEIARLERTTDLLADRTDQADLIEQAREQNTTAVKLLKRRINDLATAITLREGSTYEAAVQEARSLKETLETTQQDVALVDLIRSLQDELANARQSIEDAKAGAEADVAQLNQRIAQLEETISQKDARIQELTGEVTQVQERLGDREQQLQNNIQQAEARLQERIDQLNNQIATLQSRITDQTLQLQVKDAKIDDLQSDKLRQRAEIVKLQTQLATQAPAAPPGREEAAQPEIAVVAETATEPDGKVLRVFEDMDLCIINKGRRQGLMPETSLVVYDMRDGIPESGEGKGVLLVTRVKDYASECRIVTEKEENPIGAGDLVANIAFTEAGVKQHFFVYGEFDLSGTGMPTDQGAEEVKAMIRKSGGVVEDNIGPDVDYLVIGAEPVRPTDPGPTASLPARVNYEQQLQEFRRYQDYLAEAQQLGIQVLNANRFKAFVGYTQPKVER